MIFFRKGTHLLCFLTKRDLPFDMPATIYRTPDNIIWEITHLCWSFFRNQVLKVWPLVSNHRLCDREWIQLSAGGAEIFNVKNLKIFESSIACSHGCLIRVGGLSDLGRKVYFLPAQSWLPTYNIYSCFFSSRWGTVCPSTLCELKVECITKDLKHLALLHCLKKNQTGT